MLLLNFCSSFPPFKKYFYLYVFWTCNIMFVCLTSLAYIMLNVYWLLHAFWMTSFTHIALISPFTHKYKSYVLSYYLSFQHDRHISIWLLARQHFANSAMLKIEVINIPQYFYPWTPYFNWWHDHRLILMSEILHRFKSQSSSPLPLLL